MDEYGTIDPYSPLEWAAEQGSVERVKELLPHSTFEDMCFALRSAVAYKQYEVVEHLMTCVEFEYSIGHITGEYTQLREKDRQIFNLLYNFGGRESIDLLDTFIIQGANFPMLRQWANEEDAQRLLHAVGPPCSQRTRKI